MENRTLKSTFFTFKEVSIGKILQSFSQSLTTNTVKSINTMYLPPGKCPSPEQPQTPERH